MNPDSFGEICICCGRCDKPINELSMNETKDMHFMNSFRTKSLISSYKDRPIININKVDNKILLFFIFILIILSFLK